jgi:4-cresol dehydrogenase (hydroxylating) flavoprotein subunit
VLQLENVKSALDSWTSLLGGGVLSGSDATSTYGADCGAAERMILGAIQLNQGDKEKLPSILEIARRTGVPLYPISTGRNWGYGTSLPAKTGAVILDLGRLNRILDYDPEFGTVTLEPGVTQRQLCQFLMEKGSRYIVPTTGAGPDVSLLSNALERGYGITPHADHFTSLSNLELVLPNGEWLRAPFGSLGVPTLDRIFRNGIGPSWIGLFTQSPFGIVTSATITLAPKPERTAVFLFSLKRQEDVPRIVERVRSVLQSCGGLVGGVNLMNHQRMLSMTIPYPRDRLGGAPIMPEALAQELARKNMILPWTGFGTLYSSAALLPAVKKEVRRALSGVATRLVFLTQDRIELLRKGVSLAPSAIADRAEASLATLAKSLDLIQGIPNETALPLAYWLSGRRSDSSAPLHPAKDGCGLLWYAPLIPMNAALVNDYTVWVVRRLREFGIEPLVTLTTISDSIFDSTVPILFDRNDPAAVDNAKKCLAVLLEEGRQRGYSPYRVGIDSLPWLLSKDGESARFVAGLKRYLDPDNILSPGRYTN